MESKIDLIELLIEKNKFFYKIEKISRNQFILNYKLIQSKIENISLNHNKLIVEFNSVKNNLQSFYYVLDNI